MKSAHTRSIGLVLALALVVLAPTLTQAQSSRGTVDQSFRLRMSTVVDNVVGLAGETPAARIVLHLEEADLCLLIAIPPDPTQLQAGLFKFKKRVEGESKLETLKFKLPKPTKRDDGVRVWETCLEDAAADQMSLEKFGDAFLDITYRDPRGYRIPVEVTVDHPLQIAPVGLDVEKDSAGTLQFLRFDPADLEES